MLFVALAFSVAPRPVWRTLTTIMILVVGGLVAFSFAYGFATCDVVMRPFLAEMLFTLVPAGILHSGLGVGAIVALSLTLSTIAYAIARMIRRPIPLLAPIAAIALLPIIFMLTQVMLRAHGAHPVEGNCVI